MSTQLGIFHDQPIHEEVDSSYRGDWATPWSDFHTIQEAGYLFALDVAASAENSKCPRFYTKEDDALTKSWQVGARCFWWCNPDFRLALAFIEKAWAEMQQGHEGIMLLPANTDRPLFGIVENLGLRVLFWGTDTPGINGRINFVDPTSQKRTANTKGSILVAFTEQKHLPAIRGRGWWSVKK